MPSPRPDRFSQSIDEITHAFGDATRRAIYLYARDHAEGVTAAEIAEHFGIHTNVARHHLEKLVEAEFLDLCTTNGAHRAAGRPSKRYVTSAKEVTVSMPFRDDQLLIDLLLTMLTSLDADVVGALAEQAGRAYGARVASGAGRHLGREQALKMVAEALSQKGFAAEPHPDKHEIVSHSCPFGEVAKQFPNVVCALDRGMVEGMLEQIAGERPDAQTVASRPEGDDECITSV